MKKFLAVLLILVIAASLTACAATETIYVKTESVRTIGTTVIRMLYEYSDTGVPVSLKTYLNDNLYQSISYRTSGGMQYLTMTDSAGNTSTQCNETVYDDNGRVIEIVTTVGGTEVACTKYTYNDKDQVVTVVALDSETTVNTNYTYDEQGRVVSELQQNETDGTYTRKDVVYNEKGNIIKESTYSAEDVLDSYLEISYTDDGLQKTTTYFNADGEATGEVMVETFDENGNVILSVTSMDGEEAMRIDNTYIALEVPVE